MESYAALLALALALNAADTKTLALTLVVGAGIFVPTPGIIAEQSTPIGFFYLFCGSGDALIGLVAAKIGAPASKPIWRIASLLVAFHVLGFLLYGYPPESPYHWLVKISEHAELLACILLSHPVTKRLKKPWASISQGLR